MFIVMGRRSPDKQKRLDSPRKKLFLDNVKPTAEELKTISHEARLS
jgi:hypothetical protein